VCPDCGGDARFVAWRKKTFMSLFGPIEVDSPYYHCRGGCGWGCRSRDPMLRLGTQALTPAAEEITSLAGVLGSFADGAERVLRKMSGLRVSESTVERTTEAAGQRVAAQLEAGGSLGPAATWSWQKDALGASRLRRRLPPAGALPQ
jgi:hypothetical protein